MPELPEVETMRRDMAETMCGRRVAAVDVPSRLTFDVRQAHGLTLRVRQRAEQRSDGPCARAASCAWLLSWCCWTARPC